MSETEKRSWLRGSWVRPVLLLLCALLLAGAIGVAAGYLTRPDDPGPDLTREEAFTQSKEAAREETKRAMARRGFLAGKRDGRNHGIIAGGMAAESKVAIKVRQQRASAAQNEAASAQSELAGISSGPPPIP